ncbi:MAG TPA: SDR family NAD(P)-dependent oxidoreductase [Methylomirabilota bacterium]|nr:SDR family NAD(P)-dependent oxidoreductase [Methylomirabilota bacterium]
MSLADTVALVTGGTGTLGRAVALAFLEAGARVTVSYRGPAGRDVLVAAVPAAARARLQAVAADVTDGDGVGRLLAETTAHHGRLDALVNVAGGFAPGGLGDTDEGTWDAMLALNLRSAFLCCRAALPALRAAGGGRVVNVASRAVVPPAGGFLAYTVAKSGVIALTQALAHELRPHRIAVNAVLPSTMDTAANRRAMPDADRAAWVQPGTVAGVIRWLASPEAAGVTGTLVTV